MPVVGTVEGNRRLKGGKLEYRLVVKIYWLMVADNHVLLLFMLFMRIDKCLRLFAVPLASESLV
jgi:hypothetical protein